MQEAVGVSVGLFLDENIMGKGFSKIKSSLGFITVGGEFRNKNSGSLRSDVVGNRSGRVLDL